MTTFVGKFSADLLANEKVSMQFTLTAIPNIIFALYANDLDQAEEGFIWMFDSTEQEASRQIINLAENKHTDVVITIDDSKLQYLLKGHQRTIRIKQSYLN